VTPFRLTSVSTAAVHRLVRTAVGHPYSIGIRNRQTGSLLTSKEPIEMVRHLKLIRPKSKKCMRGRMSPIQPAENANSSADPAKPCVSQQTLLISYLSLREAVGILGFSLPIVLVLGNLLIFHSKAIEDSISNYYYTGMRGVFVGTLWAIGVFLVSYRGYERRDAVAA